LNEPCPLEYILEGTLFCGEWFVVRPGVLIPRMETELLLEYVLEKVKSEKVKGKSVKVLDLGTGSGNIAIMLAKKVDCHICAVDISDLALKIAKENAILHKVENKINFYKSNWYDDLDVSSFDVIVSNPPYVAEEEWDSLPVEVRDYEPKAALLAGRQGLDGYKKIIEGAKKNLVPGGRIVLEIGHNQAELVKNLLDEFKEIEVIKDQFGKDRIINAVWIN
jgi:release factor glutamine methyltransferase